MGGVHSLPTYPLHPWLPPAMFIYTFTENLTFLPGQTNSRTQNQQMLHALRETYNGSGIASMRPSKNT